MPLDLQPILAHPFDKGFPTHYLPIEALKGLVPHRLFQGLTPKAVYASSGTTAAIKSLSPFSEEGLARYRYATLFGFHNALTQRGLSLPKTQFSFIPSPQNAPHSSLSQMIAWFMEGHPHSYVDISQVNRIPQDRPIALFGTALHHIEVIKSKQHHPLHPESLIFETGGTKGQMFHYTREAFVQDLLTFYGIPRTRLLGEYGMCEFASVGFEVQLETFTFPDWVKLGVMAEEGIIESHPGARGALCLYDPYRIDLPFPLRTEDLVKLLDVQTLQWVMRVPKSPLRGCSLGVKEQIDVGKSKAESKNLAPYSTTVPYATIREVFATFLRQKAHPLLTQEWQSPLLASWAIADLWDAFPQTPKGYDEMLSCGASRSWDRVHLFLPGSHPIAFFYPLLVAIGRNIPVAIKPSQDSSTTHLQLLESFTKHLQKHGLKASIYPAKTRISAMPIGKHDAVFLMGQDATIDMISAHTDAPLRGFGNHTTIAWIPFSETSLIPLLLRDILSLEQRGCFSLRAIYGYGSEKELAEFVARIHKCLSVMDIPHLDWARQIAINQESLKYEVSHNSQKLLLPVFDHRSESGSLTDILSPRERVCPIVWWETTQEFDARMRTQTGLSVIGIQASEIAPGCTHKRLWDGYHDTKSILP